MADDLDQLIRAAMKTLDEQVPSGYFEALPNQTLARLEGSMQHGSSGTTDTRDAHNVPPMSANDPDTSPVARQPRPGEEREEDSGLHDIRNLAQSTKQRLSGRKITAQPFEDDVIAASSGSFKNIALPQPAKMVSLPSIEELPSKADVVAAEKAAKKAAKEATKEAKKAEPVVAAIAPALEAKAEIAPSASTRQAFSLPSQQRKGSKGPLLAIVGVGVAAAAGYVIFLQVNKDSAKQEAASAPATAAVEKADNAVAAGSAAPTITAQPIETTPPPAAAAEPAPAEAPKDEAAAGAAQLATDNVKDAEAKASDKKHSSKTTKGSKTKVEKEEPEKKEEQKAPDKKAPDKTKPVATKGGSGDEGEPSFDALLKEAGVSDQKKDTKPKLDKKSLTGDDFKKGMSSVEGKAKDCYKGTQGTALVKLTVAPSGSISKITVAGDFAGKPEASCVQSAIKAATFPPWDGGPQSFTYAVLLSD